jgi:hypothetical protein
MNYDRTVIGLFQYIPAHPERSFRRACRWMVLPNVFAMVMGTIVTLGGIFMIDSSGYFLDEHYLSKNETHPELFSGQDLPRSHIAAMAICHFFYFCLLFMPPIATGKI